MEYQNITIYLWIKVYDQWRGNYGVNKEIRLKIPIRALFKSIYHTLRPYIVAKGDITLTKTQARDFIDAKSRCLAFKSNAPFTNCISKINWV